MRRCMWPPKMNTQIMWVASLVVVLSNNLNANLLSVPTSNGKLVQWRFEVSFRSNDVRSCICLFRTSAPERGDMDTLH